MSWRSSSPTRNILPIPNTRERWQNAATRSTRRWYARCRYLPANVEKHQYPASSRNAIEHLSKAYPEVRVIGLYWDQGESDTGHADAYADNLTDFIATFRKASDLPELKVYIRKHIYRGGKMDEIIAAQETVAAKDKNCFLLDIEFESLEKNDATWSYSPNNIHINSKAFMELAKILMEDVLKNPELGSFDLYRRK